MIDVPNPRNPRLLSTYSTFRPGLLTNPFGSSGTRSERGGIGHTASCIQDCRFAWLAGSPAGIEVVDLRNPAKPRFAGRLGVRPAAGVSTHDVQVDDKGLAWVAGGAGTAAYDTTRPARPRLVTRTDRRGGRGPLNNFIHHNSQRISDRTLLITEEDLRGGCRRGGSFQTWAIRGRRARPLDQFAVERDDRARIACSAHYFDHRDGLVAAASTSRACACSTCATRAASARSASTSPISRWPGVPYSRPPTRPARPSTCSTTRVGSRSSGSTAPP